MLETDRLLLRCFDENDAFALLGVFGDPEVMRFGDGAQTGEWIRNWIEWVLQGYEKKGRGRVSPFTAVNYGLLASAKRPIAFPLKLPT